MLNRIDAALHHTNGYAYFFRGDRYVKWKPGEGVVPLADGTILRRIGVDGWTALPASFHSDIDAAFYYPSEDAVYFFKGSEYVKWREGDGPIALSSGEVIRRLGVDGWTTLPASFRTGIDAVIYHDENEHAYFFKGNDYVKYKPNQGVVTASGSATRRIGVTGWTSLPVEFQSNLDAAMYYRHNGRIYFFKGRRYVKWEPDEGAEQGYPRRIGLRHGQDMDGGWPGLSQVIAGPLIGATSPTETRVWLWLADQSALKNLEFRLNGRAATPSAINPVSADLTLAVERTQPGSLIREFRFQGLSPNSSSRIDFVIQDQDLESVIVRTPPCPGQTGDVNLAFTSCSNFTTGDELAPVYDALEAWWPDFKLMIGDNCYYYAKDLDTTNANRMNTVEAAAENSQADWANTSRMLGRQMQARNHPDFADASVRGATLATWDDHDFGFNNATGANAADYEWVSRERAGQVFRSMWPNPYHRSGDRSIEFGLRWGPVHVFMTDCRFEKDTGRSVIWDSEQTDAIITALEQSDAPLKIVVTSTQFLDHVKDTSEGHRNEAPAERRRLLEAIRGVGSYKGKGIQGKVMFLSGDVHRTELLRAADADGGRLLEFTSSASKRSGKNNYPGEPIGGARRLWASSCNTFGGLRVSIQEVTCDRIIGYVVMEARDECGEILCDPVTGIPCRTVWDLETDQLR